MNRQEWAERLPLIQAFVEGKTIQVKGWHTDYEWMDALNPSFNQDVEHRIKPEPKVIWVKETFDAGHIYTEVSYKPVEDGFVKYMEVIE